MLNIRNKNFISVRMDKGDIENAFVFDGNSKPFINSLIADGYLIKKDTRHYKPTEKLLNYVFLPLEHVLTPDHRRFLLQNYSFTKDNLLLVFNEQEIKRLIVLGWLYMDTNARYKKASRFDDFLAEGNDKILF